jgi:hypothetical protein
MRAHFQREPDSDWTTYNASLERPLLNSKRFLERVKSGTNGVPAADEGAAAEAAVAGPSGPDDPSEGK